MGSLFYGDPTLCVGSQDEFSKEARDDQPEGIMECIGFGSSDDRFHSSRSERPPADRSD